MSKNTSNAPDRLALCKLKAVKGNKAVCPIISLFGGILSIPPSVLAVPFAELLPQM